VPSGLPSAEQRGLPPLPVRDDAGRPRDRAIDLRKQRRAGLAQAIARAAFDQGFQDFAIHRAPIHAFTHVG